MSDSHTAELASETAATKEVVRRFFDACNSHDLNEIMKFFHPDIVHHSRLSDYPREGIAHAYEVTLAAFPDLCWNVIESIVEGDRVATLVMFEGTHTGEYLGKTGTGNHVRFFAVDVARVQDEMFIDHRGVLDELHLLAQIGVVPDTSLVQMS